MPNPDNPVDRFFLQLQDSLSAGTFIKLVMGKYRGDDPSLQRLIVRPVTIQGQSLLSLVHRHQARDVTHNHPAEDAIRLIREHLASDFHSAHLYTRDQTLQLDFSRRGKPMLSIARGASQLPPTSNHDHSRNSLLDPRLPVFHRLGLAQPDGRVLPSMSRKWRQIDKFAEILLHAIEHSPLQDQPTIDVVDFGAGKGYLTFAVHNVIQARLRKEARVLGVEIRPDLVQAGNRTAQDLAIKGLQFVEGDIAHHTPDRMDIMIALHACDTATDLALHKAITAGASIVISVPCCHKQLAAQLVPPDVLRPVLRFGIHAEREAEMLTDSLRALLLEAAGYTVRIAEFVSLEHTQRNSMIIAIRRPQPRDPAPFQRQVQALKDFYSIQTLELENLLK